MQRPAAISPGNSPGPTSCPGILGYACTATSTTAPRISSSRPNTASLSFIRSLDGGQQLVAYFTSPTAFIVLPNSASDLAMNLAKSSGAA